jgi:serine/threonine protein kinase/AmiR/NasT family two-component response regulator
MQQAPINILLVEDQSFQRMMMLDILSGQGFHVSEAENGKIAWDILISGKINFDLVLLDLVMPEMDGLELLEFMKQHPTIKDIPVIMMSAHNEREKIYACLDRGALDFLMKPVRRGTVLGLINQVLTYRKNEAQRVEELVGLNAYEKIQELGRGAYGRVDLVKKKNTGDLYAIKKIDFMFASEYERRSSENEATLLKVLVGPTIIRYFEQIPEENALNIVMEFAPLGTLNQALDRMLKSGQKVSTSQAIAWLSQIIIALMVLHSKHILHRDLKTANLFLTENSIIKVGDFGISKALSHTWDVANTMTGTAYVMAPEVIRGQPYDQKNDIWALGCILYELVTFNKPFDEKDKHILFEAILHKDYPPLPDDVDPNIKLLVSMMLNKDPDKRPNVWELAKFPAISNYILNFVEEHQCADTILPLFDHNPRARGGISDVYISNKVQLDEIATIAKQELELKSIRVGWFGKKINNAFMGKDLLNFCIKKFNFTPEEAMNNIQEILDKGLLYAPDEDTAFKPTSCYQFREDIADLPKNMIYVWNKEVRIPRDVSESLINLGNSILNRFNSNFRDIKASSEYQQLIRATGEIHRVEIKTLSRAERLEFFLNIYQVMYLHQMIEMPEATAGWFSDPTNCFFYNIGGYIFTLKEIKNGVLRGNQKPPGCYTRVFSSSDPRNMLPNFNDPRVLIVCPDPPQPMKQLCNFSNRLEEALREKTEEFCNIEVCLNQATEELILPKMFLIYLKDFGSSQEDCISWIWKNFTANKIPVEQIKEALRRQRLNIHYRE